MVDFVKLARVISCVENLKLGLALLVLRQTAEVDGQEQIACRRIYT